MGSSDHVHVKNLKIGWLPEERETYQWYNRALYPQFILLI